MRRLPKPWESWNMCVFLSFCVQQKRCEFSFVLSFTVFTVTKSVHDHLTTREALNIGTKIVKGQIELVSDFKILTVPWRKAPCETCAEDGGKLNIFQSFDLI